MMNNGKIKTAALHNLGCKVNAYETEAMEQQLAGAGYQIVDFHQPEDVYVVNTCTVTNVADKKSRQMLRRARKLNPEAVIVAAGCFAQASAEYLRKEGTVDIILGNNQKNQLLALLEEYRPGQGQRELMSDLSGPEAYEEMELSATLEHTRAFIKIQDGCNQFCSYCIIPYVRGRVRSRRPEQVVSEVERLAGKGYQEVVLTGIHLSSYGADLKDEQISLLSVLEQVQQIDGICRIRLGSLEPRIITGEFVDRLTGLNKVCPHFHLSLQSGCDDTLKRMNRHYTTEEYYEKCEMLRQAYEHPALTTDVITGFPGETEEEFARSRDFLERVGFYEMHVFPYSVRRGTRAASMDGQVPEEVKKARSAELLELTKKMSDQYRMYYKGRKMEILLEEEIWLDGQPYMTGHTPEYVKCALPSGRRNTLAEGEFCRILTDGMVLCR